MAAALPFLTTYDPLGTSEGSLDPLGLYQIADQLAIQLVPAVRERMQRIRFLTAIAVGSLVTENLKDDPSRPDAAPYLVWEWLVIEALIRSMPRDASIWGVPGTAVTRAALAQHGYVDARSYLKTPRIFGFHGVYKRLAIRLGLLDIHLGPGSQAGELVDVWARDRELGGIVGAKGLLECWTRAVRRSLEHSPPRTKANWRWSEWADLAHSFAPKAAGPREKRHLRKLLLAEDDKQLGALPRLWRLQANYADDAFREETLHVDLNRTTSTYRALIEAIQKYEAFARGLQSAFDVLRVEAAALNAPGYEISSIARNNLFRASVYQLDQRFVAARHALGEIPANATSLQSPFEQRFCKLAEPMDAQARALALCNHHEAVQRDKSADGKRPWFDRIGGDRIYIRHAYRIDSPQITPDKYVHNYRGWPIRRFQADLA